MSPVIRIDDEVYRWLQSQAVPFEDNPNSVLRRLAGLDKKPAQREPKSPEIRKQTSARLSRRPPLTTGESLIEEWKIPAVQARFHREGRWYEHLTRFPAAYCDCEGYVLFRSEKEIEAVPSIHAGKQVEVRGGLKMVSGYVKVANPLKDPTVPDISF